MLNEKPNEFDERNLFLQALMGLLSATQRLERAIEASPDPDAEPVPEDEPFLLCVLGFVSFREKLHSALASVPVVGEAREAPPVRHTMRARELLR